MNFRLVYHLRLAYFTANKKPMGTHSIDKRSLTNQQYFLPDMCRTKNVLYPTLISQLLAITLALNTRFLSGDFWNSEPKRVVYFMGRLYLCEYFCTFKQQINR